MGKESEQPKELYGVDYPDKLPEFYPGYVPKGGLRKPFFSYGPDGELPQAFRDRGHGDWVPYHIWYKHMVFDRNGEKLFLQPWCQPIMEYALTPDDDFRLPFQTVIFSGPKKQTKTSSSAYMALWFSEHMSDVNGEIYVQANAVDHAKERAFGMMGDAINLNPILKQRFPENWKSFIKSSRGVLIKPVANDAGTVAGANNELVLGDEIWSLTTSGHKKVWSELTPTPSRYNSMRWVASYAGYEGESEILEMLYKVGMQGEPVPEFDYMVNPDGSPVVRVHREAGMLFYWDHVGRMPYHQSKRGREEIRKQRYSLPEDQYVRLWENRWAKSKGVIKRTDWERVVDPNYVPLPMQGNRNIFMAVGVDAGTKRDRAAVATAYRKEIEDPVTGVKSLRVCKGPIIRWDPKDFDGGIINLEHTIEDRVKELWSLFNVRIVVFDPWQLVRVAEEWRKMDIVCQEYNFQSEAHRIKLGTAMHDMLRGREILTDDDPILEEERRAVMLHQSPKGIQISKQPGGRQDSWIAFALACVGARTLPPSDESVLQQFLFLGGGEAA